MIVGRVLALVLTVGGAACPPRGASVVQGAGGTSPRGTRAGDGQIARAAPGEAPVPDEALAAVARELARRVARDPQTRTPSARVVQALSWRAGVLDPLPMVLTVRGIGAALEAEVARGVREFLEGERVTHLGVGRAATERNEEEVVVVVAVRRRLQLEAVPRRVHAGTTVPLRGVLDDDLRAPLLVLTLPDGRTVETPLGADRNFAGSFLAATQGVYQVELTADSAAGSTVLANFPVYVDVEAPEVPEETGATVVDAPSAAEVELFALLNEARRRAGLPALEGMAPLTEVARAHARDMAIRRYVAHNTPEGSTPGDRLRAAGVLSGLSLENVARGYTAREIHEGLMASPGHRANILDRRVTHVGIGAAQESGPAGALLVAQEFVEVPRPVDAARLADELLTALNGRRTARGLPEVTVHPQLAEAARRAAHWFFQDPSRTQEQALVEATRSLRGEGARFRRVAAAAAFGTAPEDSVTLEALYDREATALGIGVAQGDRPGAPPQSVWVVYLLAVPR